MLIFIHTSKLFDGRDSMSISISQHLSFFQDPNAEINADIRVTSMSRSGSLAKKIIIDIMAK